MIDAKGQSLGVLKREDALNLAKAEGVDLIEIVPTARPPVAKIISFDKFRYYQEKEEKKQRTTQKAKELKHVRISPRAAENDLKIKATLADEFLEKGHKVEINLYLRGREKGNRDWNAEKLKQFLGMIKTPYLVTMTPRPGGRGLVAQIMKK
ncbi:MAG: Translation initiation factor IF-3 [Candidatus Jorgensenbacteria bacterium GW2011_GWA1_48_11]|uniref:Translation initiation factor IF-3 n=1 Tax=Candidatus Jorgensenbacteria bacterium GW2011_GWA1_48_11 TaxID=1618660 RepID=A0A0G1UBJ5_9BACT|nr:MAG: Translation initiation factor IF-3 [Candidatus Jorgensenbacteria bacterium GW2011_GWA1_48_11]KKW12029.1 MAG: Translation initiation factor IF-3 [Candidatus Jorgensenbacteria bacterium GW2011_GWB1_49_9]